MRRHGLPPSYFHGAFLQGARSSLHYLATALNNPCASDAFGADSPLEESFRNRCRQGLQAVHDEGLKIQWDIEELKKVSLGVTSITFGVTSSTDKARELKKSQSWQLGQTGVFIIIKDFDLVKMEEFSPVAQAMKISREGATICVDTFITVKQTLSLMTSDGDIMNANHMENATHLLRFEGETTPLDDGGQFDEKYGWYLVDFNPHQVAQSKGAPSDESKGAPTDDPPR